MKAPYFFFMSAFTTEEVSVASKIQEFTKNQIKEEIGKLTKYAAEYEQVLFFMRNVTDSHALQVQCLAPVADGLAYYHAYVKHTNTVTASIGLNYFSRMSTHQAIALIDRKKDGISSKIKSLNKLLLDTELKINTLDSINKPELNEEGLEFVEIQEEYNEPDSCVKSSLMEKNTKTVYDRNQKDLDEFDRLLLQKLDALEIEEESDNKDEDFTENSMKSAKKNYKSHKSDQMEQCERQTSIESSLPLFNRDKIEKPSKSVSFHPSVFENNIRNEKAAEVMKHNVVERVPLTTPKQKYLEINQTSIINRESASYPQSSIFKSQSIVERETADSDDDSDFESQATLAQHVSIEYLKKRDRFLKAGVLSSRRAGNDEEFEDEEDFHGKPSLFLKNRMLNKLL